MQRPSLPGDDCSGLTCVIDPTEEGARAHPLPSLALGACVKPLQSSSGRGRRLQASLDDWPCKKFASVEPMQASLDDCRCKNFASVEPRFCAKKQTWAPTSRNIMEKSPHPYKILENKILLEKFVANKIPTNFSLAIPRSTKICWVACLSI